MTKSKIGTMGWLDLTVDNAVGVKSIYQQVVGWASEDAAMGDYSDYMMKKAKSGKETADTCHNRGANKGLSAKWLLYAIIADIGASLANVVVLGGKLLYEIRSYGDSRFALTENPAVAVCELYQE
ncbi:MAG: VOC family protein [Alteromonas sp.]